MTDTQSNTAAASAAAASDTIVDPLWPGPSLFVPIGIECLLVGVPNQQGSWAELAIDYRKVPANVDPEPQPFQLRPANAPPGTGAHLQATLPMGYRQGQQQPDGSVLFPPIPNRWLVARSVVTTPGAAPVFTVWVLQGDFLGDMGEGSNTYPDPVQTGNTQWVGRAFTFDNWTNPAGPAQPLLRSVGPGSVSWVVTYDNTLNVLSFYDSLSDVSAGNVTYAMLGWYSPSGFDPLLGVTDADPQGFTTQDEWQSILNTLLLNVHGESGLAAAEAAWQDWQAANPISGGATIPAIQMQLASQTLCHGMVFGMAWNGPQQSYPRDPVLNGQNPVSVAVGGTGVEAIAAWMANILNQPDLEDLILAVQQDLVFDYLQQPSVFATRTLEARFAKADGGTVWLVARPDYDPSDRGRTLQTVDLSPAQTQALTALNDDQAALDATSQLIASNVWQLFALVYKLQQLGPFSPDTQTVQDAIDAVMATLTTLDAQRTAQAAAVEADKTALLGLLGSEFVLSSNGNTRFHAPAATTVMVAGAQQDTRLLPPGTDGGPEDSLFSRFTGQTVSALTVIEPVGGTTQTIDANDLTSRVPTLPPASSGVPKEMTDYLVEVMLFDTSNARFLAAIAYQKAGVTPTSAQLDTLAATIAAQQTAPWNATPATPYSEETVGAAVGFTGVVPLKRSVLPWSPPWTPLYIDWQVTWYPTADAAAGMLDGWTLEGFDYSWTGTAIGTASETISGRSLVGTQIAAGLAEKLNDLVTLNPNFDELPQYQQDALTQAAADIAEYDIVTEALSGFGGFMLMQQGQMTELTSDDPAVENWLELAPSVVPLPGSGTDGSAPGFYPVRSGHYVINQLWVVDAFGQILRTTNPGQDVLPIRSKSVTTPDAGGQDNKRFVQVAPRIQQPARVALNLLDAEDDAIPTNSSNLTSPVAGWLLPNHLDNSVQVFAADGTPLGEILPVETDNGRGIRWDPAPGLNLPLGSPPAIGNAHLLGFVQGLLAQGPVSGDQALQDLLDVIDVTLWRTTATPQPDGDNLAVLIGQPVAVVRADISLNLDGDPAYDQSWAATGKNDDGGVTAMPFPVYVGDIAYDGNGALGFFLDDDYSLLNPLRGFDTAFGTVRRALSSRTGNPRSNLGRAMARLPTLLAAGSPATTSGYLNPYPSFPLLPDGPVHRLTVLMDPRGSIPAVSGILPVETVSLPPGVVSAMNTLLATFRVGPLLIDPREVQMPLPGNVSGTWSWIARTGVTVWETVANLKSSQPQALLPTAIPAAREGWLGLVPTPASGPSSGQSGGSLKTIRPVADQKLAHMQFHERYKAMAAAPAATTPPYYQYRFDPNSLIIGATTAPTLTVTNPNATTALTGTQTIYVKIPVGTGADSIATSLGGVSVTTSTPAWLALTYFSTNPPYIKLTGPALAAGASLSVYFNNLVVNDAVGTAAFPVQESFTGGGTTAVTIAKTDQPLAIQQFYANPITVAQGQSTTLNWTVSGGSYVLIQPGSIKRPVQGSSFTDSLQMPVSQAQTIYTLQLYTDDRQFKQDVTTAYLGPVSATLSCDPSGPIDTDASAVLSWSSTYAVTPLYLSTPSGAQRVGAQGQQTVVPGSYLSGNQSSVTFSLQALGYQGPVNRTATVTFNPVRIRWFRYTDATLTQVTYNVVNPSPGSPTVSSSGQDYTLTAYGPGAGSGPLVAHLGPGPYLQVQLLSATPSPATPGATVTVSYQTLNATSATLAIGNQAAISVPLDTTKQTGQTTITAPSASTVLTLTISGNGQAPVSSELDLPVTTG